MALSQEDRDSLVQDIVKALSIPPQLNDDELMWVRLAIQREAQSIKLRQAIIEKTFAGLIWAGLVGLGYLIVDFLKSHGFK